MGGIDLVDDARLDSGQIVVQVVTGTDATQSGVELDAERTASSAPANSTTRDFSGRGDPDRDRSRDCAISIDGELLARDARSLRGSPAARSASQPPAPDVNA